jgi:hypothetical protein
VGRAKQKKRDERHTRVAAKGTTQEEKDQARAGRSSSSIGEEKAAKRKKVRDN